MNEKSEKSLKDMTDAEVCYEYGQSVEGFKNAEKRFKEVFQEMDKRKLVGLKLRKITQALSETPGPQTAE